MLWNKNTNRILENIKNNHRLIQDFHEKDKSIKNFNRRDTRDIREKNLTTDIDKQVNKFKIQALITLLRLRCETDENMVSVPILCWY